MKIHFIQIQEINIQKIDKCTKGCNSFKCPKWLCNVEMHIDKDGDIKLGHDIDVSDNKSQRWKNMAMIALGQSKMVRHPVAGGLYAGGLRRRCGVGRGGAAAAYQPAAR